MGGTAAGRRCTVVGDVCDDESEGKDRIEPNHVGTLRGSGSGIDQVRRAKFAACVVSGRSEKAECR